MIIEFDESTPLHTIKELAPGLRVEERAVELSIPDLEKAAKVEFAVDFHGAPVGFVKLSYNEVPLDPTRTGHGNFVFDPKEFGHTLKIEFDTKAIPAAKQKEALWSYLALGKDAPSPKPPPPLPVPPPAAGET